MASRVKVDARANNNGELFIAEIYGTQSQVLKLFNSRVLERYTLELSSEQNMLKVIATAPPLKTLDEWHKGMEALVKNTLNVKELREGNVNNIPNLPDIRDLISVIRKLTDARKVNLDDILDHPMWAEQIRQDSRRALERDLTILGVNKMFDWSTFK